jgi:hypothetical protein
LAFEFLDDTTDTVSLPIGPSQIVLAGPPPPAPCAALPRPRRCRLPRHVRSRLASRRAPCGSRAAGTSLRQHQPRRCPPQCHLASRHGPSS